MEQKEIPVRTVDTQVFLGAVKEMVREGWEVPVTITGGSMTPFLVHGRDRVLLSPISRPLQRGDMVLYQRKSGQYVMHRIRRVKKEGTQYDLIGDAQTVIEGPIEADQIIALVTAVYRKGRWLGPGSFWWEFFRHVWLHMIPVRRYALRCYAQIRRKHREKEH